MLNSSTDGHRNTTGPFRLRVLGTTDLVDAEGRRLDSILRQPKRLSLLAYLCCEDPGGIHPRDRLLALFWPERPDRAARGALNQSLYALRGALGKDVIVSLGSAGVGLAPGSVTCDASYLASVFEDSAGILDDEKRRTLEEALTLYEGDLLEGVYPPGADGFLEWLDRIRERIKQDVVAAHSKLAREYQAAGELASSLMHAQRAAELSPFNEEGHRQLLQAYLAIGDRGQALRAHQEYEALLNREFGTGTSAETSCWVEALLDKYSAQHSAPPVGLERWESEEESDWLRGEPHPDRGPGSTWATAAWTSLSAAALVLWIMMSVAWAGPLPDGVVVQTDESQPAQAAAEALFEVAETAGDPDIGLLRAPAGQAGIVGWITGLLPARNAGYELRVFEHARGDSLRVELSALRSIPGRILSQMTVRVADVEEWLDLADQALGLVAVQLSREPVPWRESVGRAPRYTALRAFVRAHEALELRRDREAMVGYLREAIVADPRFLLAWFELADRAPGSSVSDSTIWVQSGSDTLTAPLTTLGSLLDVERDLEGLATSGMTSVERAHWLAVVKRRSRSEAFAHWRTAARVAPRFYVGRAIGTAVALGAYEEVLELAEELPGPDPGTESHRLWVLNRVLALRAAGRHEKGADLARRELQRAPDHTYLENHLVWSLAGQGTPEAIEEIRSVVARRFASAPAPVAVVTLLGTAVDALAANGHALAAEELQAEGLAQMERPGVSIDGHSLTPDLLITAGRLEEARDVLEFQIRNRDEAIFQEWKLARVHALLGERGRALAVVEDIQQNLDSAEGPPVGRFWAIRAQSEIFAALGDDDRAADLMEVTLAEGMPHYRLLGMGCGEGPSSPRLRRLLRGYPMC